MTGGRILDLTDDSFDGAVKRLRGPVLVRFGAEWCDPCRDLDAHLDDLAERFRGRAHVARVDVDANGDLTHRFGVRSVPTLIVFRGGRVVDQMIGAAPVDDIADLVSRHLD